MGITRVTVAGFKSIRQQQSIEIRPLTILAGANSSGKSSMMQPLLLLKQTVEATFEPDGLLLNGSNVRFTSADQVLSRTPNGESVNLLCIGVALGPDFWAFTEYREERDGGLHPVMTSVSGETDSHPLVFRKNMPHEEVRALLPAVETQMGFWMGKEDAAKLRWDIVAERGFLKPRFRWEPESPGQPINFVAARPGTNTNVEPVRVLKRVIHIPGLRGNPERSYPVAAVRELLFPGQFQDYVASVIAQWQASDQEKLNALIGDLDALRLTSTLAARRVNGSAVEILVGRRGSASADQPGDLVSIADVGLGVSQVLPVLVALHVATPQHLVYVDQPEIHLHPRAIVALARIMAKAATRGVRMVVETHSPLLLLAIQAMVAEGAEGLTPDLVKLHWFSRSEEDGSTSIASTELDQAGAFGPWPEDFGDVEMELERRYLDAAEAKLGGK